MSRFRPLASAALQAGALGGVGDAIAQSAEPSRDWARTGRFACVGACLVGPSLRVWYGTLHRLFGASGAGAALKKVCLDQLVFAPPFLAALLTVLKSLQGKTLPEIETELRESYVDVLAANYCFWPAVQLGNFYLVPLGYQVLTVQTAALLWNVYLSRKAHPK